MSRMKARMMKRWMMKRMNAAKKTARGRSGQLIRLPASYILSPRNLRMNVLFVLFIGIEDDSTLLCPYKRSESRLRLI